MSEQGVSASKSGAAGDRARLEAAAAACEAELTSLSREAAPREWAAVQARLGEALAELADLHQGEWLKAYELRARAKQSLEAALEDGPHLPRLDRAMLQMQLGQVLSTGVMTDAPRSVDLCSEAARAISREDRPELWGTAQRCLAEALIAPFRGTAHDPPNSARNAEFLQQMEEAVRASRAAVSAIRARRPLAQANVTLVRALTALGKQCSRTDLLDEAIALGRATTARGRATMAGPEPEVSTADVAAAYAALGNAALARARHAAVETSYHSEAVGAHRTALALEYDDTKSFRQQSRYPLGTALLLLAECRSETIDAQLMTDLKRIEASGSAADRLGWAVDVLAVANVLSSKNASTATDLLTALGMFADRAKETSLWEAWATGILDIGYWLNDQTRKERFHQQLKACVDAHGTPDMRLAWAQAAAPGYSDKRPLERQREMLAEIRALADRYPEPQLRIAWATGVLNYFSEVLKNDSAAASRILDDLKAYAGRTGDPVIWSIWGQAVCRRLETRAYSEANLELARVQLEEARPYLRMRNYQGWPQAAATIHDLLLVKDQTAASQLRAEIKAIAETVKEDATWRAWTGATVNAIKQIRLTDYAAARALFAELEAGAGGARDYDRKRALASARTLMQDREVKLAHGMIDEVLKPLTLEAQAMDTGSGLRVSRLDASKAPNLETVGREIYCREMILTGTAIEELPDDLQVTQRLDVSQCRRLKRLPAGLKVGQLSARECTALEALPAGLRVSYLDLTGCSALKALPADLVVRHGRLSLRGCERLTALPDTIGPIAQLDLAGCLNITAIPPRLVVTAWIDIGGSGVAALPPQLEGIAIRWRGVPVDERTAFRPETLDVREILDETNAERRRVMMERFGLDRFMSQAEAQVLDEDRDAGGPRRLLRIELADDEPLVCVSVICPTTHRHFMLRVPPTMTTCRHAVAWTAGFDDPDEYQPTVET
jgi:uncharacterized protein DUF6745